MNNKITLDLPQIEKITRKLDLFISENEKLKTTQKPSVDLISSKRLATLLDLTEQTLSNYSKNGYFKKYSLDRKIFYCISEVENAVKSECPQL